MIQDKPHHRRDLSPIEFESNEQESSLQNGGKSVLDERIYAPTRQSTAEFEPINE